MLAGRLGLVLGVALLGACSTTPFAVDDGRKVNEELLRQIRNFGAGEQALRPAIARSSTLAEPQCEKQWELPISVATSYGWSKDDRVAWVRGLGVDERLTVVAIAPDAPLQVRDRIVEIERFKHDNAEKMLAELVVKRDAGRAFEVKLASGKVARIAPFQVCRGYTRLAPPNTPQGQDYHWLMSMHPLEVVKANLTEDEALWMVLWTQGLSEVGGLRMKAYHYTTKIAGTLYNLFTIASGLKAASLAAEVAIKSAQHAATSLATDYLRKQLIEQATRAANERLRDEVTSAAQRLAQQELMATAMKQAALNRGSLSGVAWVASFVFEKADTWAYTRLESLKGNPLAGFTLHQKLIDQRLTANSMVFDPERMASISKLVEERGQQEHMYAILGGFKPEELWETLTDMPLASAPDRFTYAANAGELVTDAPFSRGLIDGLLDIPIETASAR